MSALTPTVLDTDPGIDDALALLLAWGSPELDVLALTRGRGQRAARRHGAQRRPPGRHAPAGSPAPDRIGRRGPPAQAVSARPSGPARQRRPRRCAELAARGQPARLAVGGRDACGSGPGPRRAIDAHRAGPVDKPGARTPPRC